VFEENIRKKLVEIKTTRRKYAALLFVISVWNILGVCCVSSCNAGQGVLEWLLALVPLALGLISFVWFLWQGHLSFILWGTNIYIARCNNSLKHFHLCFVPDSGKLHRLGTERARNHHNNSVEEHDPSEGEDVATGSDRMLYGQHAQ